MVHVAVVGAYGSAGAAVAEELVDEPDVRLTLVDDGGPGDSPGGGLCILRGCMPSKEVLSAAAHRYQARVDERLTERAPGVDVEAVLERKDDNTLDWAGHRREAIHEYADRENVEFVHGRARFVDDHTLAVGDRTVEADYVVVATGSSVNVPDLPGIEDVHYLTSADVLDATAFPDSGIVMGFGYVGIELAPYIASVGGTELTVIEHDDRPLDEADPPFGEELVDIYERDFPIEVRRNTVEKRLEPTDDGGVRLYVEAADGGDDPGGGDAGEGDGDEGDAAESDDAGDADASDADADADDDAAATAADGGGEEEVLEADELFLFTGRTPNLDGLGLEHTTLQPGPSWVEPTLQARDDPRVFVVGDVNGREQILHVAKEEGYTAAENVLRHARGDDLVAYDPTHHHVVFSGLGVYPYARVGHAEFSAEREGLDSVAVSRRAEEDGVFESKDVPDGLATLVVDTEDGTVLGWQGLHYHADVMAKTMQVAVELGLDVRELPDRAYHPTTPELLDGLFRAASERVGR